MEWTKELIGEKAGVVWRALAEDNIALSWEDLLNKTGLDSLDLASAIGWLAKEDKICIYTKDEKNYFELYQVPYF